MADKKYTVNLYAYSTNKIPIKIPYINQMSPVMGYKPDKWLFLAFAKNPNVWMYDANTGAYITMKNIADYYPEEGGGGSGGATSADKVSYDNSTSGMSSNNVQGAIDELSDDSDSIPVTEKGAANGVATLDADAKIPVAQIPDVFEETSNKVISIDSSSTDDQYASAKCVYDIVGSIATRLGGI